MPKSKKKVEEVEEEAVVTHMDDLEEATEGDITTEEADVCEECGHDYNCVKCDF